jgi:hypothetical protein
MFRRKRLPEHLAEAFASFGGVVARVERAKSALTEAVPTTRLPGRPLGEVLLEFEDELREALREMPSWRSDEVADAWDGCVDALEEALQVADRLRTEAPPSEGFEALIGTLGELMAPLEAFEEAGRRFRDLRR